MRSFISIAAFLSLALAAPAPAPDPAESLESRTSCPGKLQASYVSPSLIVPISKKLPNVALPAGTLFGMQTPNDISSIYNFIVPDSAANKNCTLEFFFPSYSQSGGPYVFSGPGDFVFTGYNPGSGAVAGVTTYNNQPTPGPYPAFPPIVLKPGNAYVIDVGPCFPGIVSGMISSTDTSLFFMQKTTTCPLGIFIGVDG